METRIEPWPAERPNRPSSDLGWMAAENAHGLAALASGKKTIVEIGTFHGLSARHMAKHAPGATIYCVDPFTPYAWAATPGEGHLETWLASCWEFRSQLVPVVGKSPEALRFLADRGVVPELVYVDGDHAEGPTHMDIATTVELWPSATVCGDDYCTSDPGVIAAVNRYTAEHGRSILPIGRFWRLL